MIRPEYAVTADGRQLDATTITDSYIKAVNINRSIIANAQVAQISLYTVCKGLKEMRDGKLYKELGYQNFKDYCENEVGMSYDMSRKYIMIFGKILTQVNILSQLEYQNYIFFRLSQKKNALKLLKLPISNLFPNENLKKKSKKSRNCVRKIMNRVITYNLLKLKMPKKTATVNAYWTSLIV